MIHETWTDVCFDLILSRFHLPNQLHSPTHLHTYTPPHPPPCAPALYPMSLLCTSVSTLYLCYLCTSVSTLYLCIYSLPLYLCIYSLPLYLSNSVPLYLLSPSLPLSLSTSLPLSLSPSLPLSLSLHYRLPHGEPQRLLQPQDKIRPVAIACPL
jgi:hypothetical protein